MLKRIKNLVNFFLEKRRKRKRIIVEKKGVEEVQTAFKLDQLQYSPEAVGFSSQELQFSIYQHVNKYIDAGESIIDFGCGRGDFLAYRINQLQLDVDYLGIDKNLELVGAGRSIYKGIQLEWLDWKDIKTKKDCAINILSCNINYDNALKKRMNKSTFKVEKYFKLITESIDWNVIIPRGFLSSLTDYCDETSILYKIIDSKKIYKNIDLETNIVLHKDQVIPVQQCLTYDQWVLVAPPWSWKTVMALWMVAYRKQPTLIIVHRKQLLEQRKERVSQFLGISIKDIWQVWWWKNKKWVKITIAMIQSLNKQEEDFYTKFGLIIVDECHHIPAKSFRTAIVKFNSYYIYGLTATPIRKHNDEKLIYYYIGDVIASIQKKSLPNHNNAINIIESDFSLPFNTKVDNYEILSKALVFNEWRNRLIVQHIKIEIQKWRTILILTERKDHIDMLTILLRKIWEVITLSWSDSKSMRKVKEEQLKLWDFQIVLATWQYIWEGWDGPSFDSLFLVYPFSFEWKLIQYMWRIERGVVTNRNIYDIRDVSIKYLDNQFRKREKYYKKLHKKWLYTLNISSVEGLF